jgi:hypothetical protein
MRAKAGLRRAALVIGAVGSFVAPAAIPATAEAKHCPPGYVHGSVDNAPKCLHAGEFCSSDDQSDYRRYGFKCVLVNGYHRLEHR